LDLTKKLAYLVAFVCTGFASLVVSLDQTSFNVDSRPPLVAPAEAEVGELVRIHSGSEQVKWMIIPEVIDYQEYGVGSLAISFRAPGDYIVVAATGGHFLELQKRVITVTGNAGPETPKTPEIPLVPEVSKPPGVSTLASQVTAWCQEAKVTPSVAARLAENFSTIASSSSVSDVSTLLRETATLNSLIPAGSHQQVLAKVQAAIIKPPRPESVEDYRKIWKEVSEGFSAYKG
jgi:hypothetical protein